MKKLFLAVVDLTIADYMQDWQQEIITILVWGVDEDDARETIRKEYDKEDSFSVNRWPNIIHLTQALGSPLGLPE